MNRFFPVLRSPLGIGLLIGLERGWRTREAKPGSRTAGIRTFAISGLLGGITGAIIQASGGVAHAGGAVVFAVSFASYASVIAVFSREENRADGTFSATTVIVGMLTFSLGAYAIVGDVRIAAAAAVATAAILALREELHGWIEKITWPELRSGVVLLAMTFIVLPLVPNEPIGPFGGTNLREVWIIAIVLASVSFIGYAAVKYFGASGGVLIAAALGGLVSSTAVTVGNARHAASGEASPRLLADADQAQKVDFRNPFGFWSVIGFAFFLAAIIILGRAVGESFGAPGAIAGAVVIGLVDVDSVTVSIARLTPESLGPEHAAFAIFAAVASNTIGNFAIGAIIGSGRFAAEIGAMILVCTAVAAAAFEVTFAMITK